MAAIDDLIAQVEDKALRERLREETDRLTREKKFGLVFEEHLPELSPIYSAPIRKGISAAHRDAQLTDVWRVLSVSQGQALCINPTSGEQQEIATDDLVAVRRFGEPIFPALTPVDFVQNGPANLAWHTLIESDNYHALQLLGYIYSGQVDCIYIDPPFNTGAKDWKYNNRYVDKNDRWRHSKWLAMMRRRLILAKQLLNKETGVLIVAIDEHEVHHLRMLLEAIFPETFIQMVTSVTNPKGVTQGRFSRVEEYQIFCFNKHAKVRGWDDDLLNPKKETKNPRWKGLLRSGTNARRADRKNMFYPVLIDKEAGAIVGTGNPLPFDDEPDLEKKIDGFTCAWPIRTDGSFGNWGVGHSTLQILIAKGFVSLGRYDPKRRTYGITYLSQLLRDQIDAGEIKILGYDDRRNVVDIEYVESAERKIKTVWHRSLHDAGAYGADMIATILGKSRAFSFPKSLYYVRDAIAAVVGDKPNALVLDFFGGSGTTLHAVEMLNQLDFGNRRCILVTNNEVSQEKSIALNKQGLMPGDEGWEQSGICRSVTWPRSKYAILGRRNDGTVLEGDYLTGRMESKEKARTFYRLGFIEPGTLETAVRKKEVVSLIDGVPMSHIKPETAYFVSEDEQHTAAVLFDDAQADAFLEELGRMDHITRFYIVTRSNKTFQNLKSEITDMLGPIELQEEAKRPMSEGFKANLEYFKLDFLEKDHVALGQQFEAILPILWMQAGAVGPRPDLLENMSLPSMLLPSENTFAVLLDETSFADFRVALSERDDITHIFLITDSKEAFQEMAAQMHTPHVIQLYRDYLENFAINRGDTS